MSRRSVDGREQVTERPLGPDRRPTGTCWACVWRCWSVSATILDRSLHAGGGESGPGVGADERAKISDGSDIVDVELKRVCQNSVLNDKIRYDTTLFTLLSKSGTGISDVRSCWDLDQFRSGSAFSSAITIIAEENAAGNFLTSHTSLPKICRKSP